MSELIERALRDATQTRVAVVAEGALALVGPVFRELFGDAPGIVVGDERTMAAAGDRVVANLRAAGLTVTTYVFPGEPELYAAYENVETLREALRARPGHPVAVGAGTLNDIVKRAAAELDRPYLQVGTAASMDGYAAFGASIAYRGFKNTLECPAPVGSICDLTVMAAAPATMRASGYGDLLGKLTAGADWLVADAVGVEPIHQTAWDLVQGPLRASLSRPEALAAGDVSAIGGLAEGLVMSGLAMQAHASSRPSSGSEHQFSHLWEMEGHGLDVTPRLSHGFKVAVGSVAVAALYDRIFALDLSSIDADAAVAAWPSREDLEAQVRSMHPDPRLVDETVRQQLAKWIPAPALGRRIETFQAAWPDLRPRLRGQLLPAAEVQRMLRAAGAPAHPADIGLDWARFRATYLRAGMIRKRYTILDTLLELNVLDDLVADLFAPDGFWGGQR